MFVCFCFILFFLMGELAPNSRIFIMYECACSIFFSCQNIFFSFALSQCPQKCHHIIRCYLLDSVNPQVPHCTEKYLSTLSFSAPPPSRTPQLLHHNQHFPLTPCVIPPASLLSAERVPGCPTDRR